MSVATKDTVTVTFDPNSINLQSDVITAATPTKAGAMSAAQAAKLAGLLPGGGETLTQAYDNGSSSSDQTALIDPAKGGGVIAKAKAALAGRLFAALDSVGGVILDAIDAAIPIVKLAGAFVQNDPGFGSPVMGSQTPGSFMSYTADGIGGTWGGTGVTPHAAGADSEVVVSLNDAAPFVFNKYGITSSGGFAANPANGNPLPAGFVAGTLFTTVVGNALTVSGNAIAPTDGIHHVGAGLIKTITVPLGGNFRGSIVLIPSAAFTYDNTGNIAVAAGGGLAVVDRPMIATFDGSKWYMSY